MATQGPKDARSATLGRLRPNGPRGFAARLPGAARARGQRSWEGIELLLAIVALMWIVEVVNALDSDRIAKSDGIIPRNLDHLWGILTAPFLHLSWGHLISNTIPFVFMGVIIAIRGARRLAAVTALIIVLGGLGTWLIAPANSNTVGASGVVFGYAAYLLARGVFDRSVFELLTGAIVGLVWGGALLSSLVPHSGISWQGHLCGGIAGVIAAFLLARERSSAGTGRGTAGGSVAAGIRRPAVGSGQR